MENISDSSPEVEASSRRSSLAELGWNTLPAEEVETRFRALVAGLVEEHPIDAAIQRVARLQARKAALEAEEARELAALARLYVAEEGPGARIDLVYRSLAAELALACRVSDRTMESRILRAEELVDEYPATLQALETGSIGIGHARVIVECGDAINDPELRSQYEVAVVERAVKVTPGRLRRLARQAAEKLAAVTFEDRHLKAKESRSVRIFEIGDGMSELVHIVPSVLAVAMFDRLTAQAKAVKAANPADARTLDQVRADLACELVLTGQPSGDPDAPHAAGIGIRPEVSILIPVLTLLGESDEPASIAGRGPIGLDDATRLAGNAPSLIRVLTHPVSQQVLAVDSYRPSKKLRRYLHRRDGRCRCPSCTKPPGDCDLDHTTAWQHGGKTEVGNLADLCPNHHTIKHLPGWSVKQISLGVLEWTSPHGVTAIDTPDTPVTFQ
ncbi:HNH endonuclease signature motif containing protein [Cryobacterium sp. BB307]|uniref:HNH endonuclease signature motif containing protein n=1 Tax=Cryobacterium sp. BB307 TaxID=2716317 RepID=UPI001444C73C|nr:HNH endonuclease signature motif containing protein [Cryobacterium sp. BB307]